MQVEICKNSTHLLDINILAWGPDATAEDGTAVDTSAEDGNTEDVTAELFNLGWTLRRSHQILTQPWTLRRVRVRVLRVRVMCYSISAMTSL